MKKEITKEFPLPTFATSKYQRGRGYKRREYLGWNIKFPCLPLRWADNLNEYGYKLISSVFSKYMEKKFKTYHPLNKEVSDKVLMELFGIDTRQAFYRVCKRKGRIVYRNKRTMWCIPKEDIRKVLFRYRANQWNESEKVPKEFWWVFKKLDCTESWPDFTPDYSQFDLGPERKPPLYICNICGRTTTKEEWEWGQPMAGLARWTIMYCPECHSKAGDIFDNLDKVKSGQEIFHPKMKWQDNYIAEF